MDKFAKWLRRSGIALAALIALTASVKSAELPSVNLQDFSPGLATKNDAADICDTCASSIENADVHAGYIEKRRGSVKQNSTVLGSFTSQSVRFIHEYPDTSGNFWLLTVSSNTLFKSNDGGATNSILSSALGITSTSKFHGVNAFGKARLTDGTTNWILFDGASVTVSTSSPKGKICEFFAERIWTAGVAASPSTLYASANGNPEDWVTDSGTDDDAFSTFVRQSDGYEIRAIKRWKQGLLVFKDYSLDIFTLNADGLTYTRTPVSNVVGTQYPDSVVERENDVIWLAHDGYYSYNGSTIKKISEAIKPTVDSIQQLSSGSRSYSQTTQTDFQSGTHSNTSANITAGDVVLTTWTATDTSDADFVAGTLTNLTTQTVSGSIYLSTSNTNVLNNSFETGSVDNWDNFGNQATYAAYSGTYGIYLGATACGTTHSLVVYILDPSLAVLQTTTIDTDSTGGCADGAFAQYSLSLSAFRGRNIKIKFDNSSTWYVTSDTFLCSGQTLTFYWRRLSHTFPSPLFSRKGYAVDLVEGGRSTVYSGTFVSQIFNTSISSPSWLNTTVSTTTNGNTITFETQVATSTNGSWDSLVSWTPGGFPASANKQYIRYKITMATATANTALPFVSDVTLGARALSGRYLSPAISVGTSITSWGDFAGTSATDGGSQTFILYTDTDTLSGITLDSASTFTSSQTITNGATPSIAVAAAAYVVSTFSITLATQNPSMSDFSLRWNEGAANFPVWSTYHEGDYISAVSTYSTTGNDTLFIYDRNGAWTLYSGLPVYCFTRYRQKIYFGSNQQGDIVRMQADGVYSDYSGSVINSQWTSKEFNFGYPLTDKTVTRYYVTAKYRANDEATFSYGVNRGTLTTNTLDLDSVTGFYRKSFVPVSLTYYKGLSHRFKISNSIAGDRFDILSVTIKANLETSP